MRKRIVSLLLVLMMVLGTLPMSVFAAGLDTSNLTFDVSDPAGYVTVSFVDNGVRPENATMDNAELYGEAVGTIVGETQVPFKSGDSVADVTVRLLNALGLEYDSTGTVEDGFYLAALENFELNDVHYATFGEFDAGSQSGWCVRLNNWHINQGASAFEVEDGDTISWLYTCQYGADVGADFSNKSAEITDVTLSDTTLSLVYDESEEEYTCVVPEDITSIAFEVVLENYASVVTVTVDGVEAKYRPNKAIAVQNNSVIEIATALDYMDAANNNQITTYTDTMKIRLVPDSNQAPVVNANAP
ncbi:MAG: DUF4430 domain-containing protein, partial [Firmicutes bacterium]|nr:DUF4430 domain-containing protein [Bacillota bacterium]